MQQAKEESPEELPAEACEDLNEEASPALSEDVIDVTSLQEEEEEEASSQEEEGEEEEVAMEASPEEVPEDSWEEDTTAGAAEEAVGVAEGSIRDATYRGVLVLLNYERRCGFIRSSEAHARAQGLDVFVGAGEVRGVEVGAAVAFQVREGPEGQGGLQAHRVQRIEGPAAAKFVASELAGAPLQTWQAVPQEPTDAGALEEPPAEPRQLPSAPPEWGRPPEQAPPGLTVLPTTAGMALLEGRGLALTAMHMAVPPGMHLLAGQPMTAMPFGSSLAEQPFVPVGLWQHPFVMASPATAPARSGESEEESEEARPAAPPAAAGAAGEASAASRSLEAGPGDPESERHPPQPAARPRGHRRRGRPCRRRCSGRGRRERRRSGSSSDTDDESSGVSLAESKTPLMPTPSYTSVLTIGVPPLCAKFMEGRCRDFECPSRHYPSCEVEVSQWLRRFGGRMPCRWGKLCRKPGCNYFHWS